MNISGPAAVAKPEMLFYAPGDLTVTVKMLRVCADTGDTLNVTACLIVLEDKKHPGRFRFHGTLRGDGAIGDYSSSVGLSLH